MNERKPIRLLFLHARVGEGHTQACINLARCAEQKGGISDIHIYDCFNIAHPMASKITRMLYIWTIRYLPAMWVFLYRRRSPLMRFIHFVARVLMRWALYRNLSRIIRNIEPDAIVCTHFFPLPPLYNLKKRHLFKIYTVVTDGDLHPLWTYEGVDTYFIAHQNAKGTYNEKTLRANIITAGIPIGAEFKRKPVDRVREKLGLSNRFTVLITGGGEGMGPIENIARHIDKSLSDINIMILCGRNERLRERLSNTSYKNETRIFGFIDNIIDLYDASDCVVGKPGGITTAEVFARGKPFVAYIAYGGQEEGNIRRYKSNKWFYTAEDIKEIPKILEEILLVGEDKEREGEIISSSDRGVSDKIIEYILTDLRNNVK